MEEAEAADELLAVETRRDDVEEDLVAGDGCEVIKFEEVEDEPDDGGVGEDGCKRERDEDEEDLLESPMFPLDAPFCIHPLSV